jgi:hypothetical protein
VIQVAAVGQLDRQPGADRATDRHTTTVQTGPSTACLMPLPARSTIRFARDQSAPGLLTLTQSWTAHIVAREDKRVRR